MTTRRGRWTREARRFLPAMRAWRAAIHQEPELSNEEVRTRAKIVDALTGLGLRPTTYPGFNGVSAALALDRSGPTVALRADLDALPVTEETGLPFASRFPGRMHACGHDVHMAALLGAAAVLKRNESRLRGPVKLLFQPAEEDGIDGGAAPFIARGALERPHVDFVVGQHLAGGIPLGVVGWAKGPMMGAADHFIIRVRGRGGHAGYPHRTVDAVVVAAEVITGLQALVSRLTDPTDPVVISVGMVHGGTRHNVLPDTVDLEGTVRTVRPATRATTEKALRRRVRHIAASLGARATVKFLRGYPVLVNDPTATDIVVRALTEELGGDRMVELEAPVMGAEDFSLYLEKRPGTFLFLGVDPPGHTSSLHSARFAPDESALVHGAAVLCAAVEGLQRG
ncbi:MAG: M20 family metallopeptidase [Thermoplasmata archaeon]|nr:M20 family metallopeptidase [Thermoplasmata archaeon]